MGVVGVVEIAVGAAILAGYARVAGFVACAWLLAIALNLVMTGKFLDVAARDVGLALGAFALGHLARVHEPARAAARPAQAARVPA